MNVADIIDRLDRFPQALQSAALTATPAQSRWKPPSEAWSILEIVNHLADEEVLDFRARLQSVFRDPAAQWLSIDPVQWARERKYNHRELADSVSRFADARAESIAWLRSLARPDWTTAHNHPKFGSIRAGDLLAAWAAHDALHLRQIAKRLYELAAADAPGFSIKYAGEWGP